MTKTKQRSTLSITSLAALLSGLVCYRLGSFVGCSSPRSWRLENDFDSAPAHVPATPNSRHYRHDATPTPSQRQQRQRQETGDGLPYKCGIVLFYHIPSTGGGELTEERVVSTVH